MTGFTAYQGAQRRVQAGETVVVSAASGAEVVGQSKIRGAQPWASPGVPEVRLLGRLGFDACIDYKVAGLAEHLAAAVPDGIDIYFENVGGDVLEAVIPLLNDGCRVPVCGYIAHYNLTEGEARPTPPQRLRRGFPRSATGRSFRFFAFTELATRIPLPKRHQRCRDGSKKGTAVTDGLESSIGAFIGMLPELRQDVGTRGQRRLVTGV